MKIKLSLLSLFVLVALSILLSFAYVSFKPMFPQQAFLLYKQGNYEDCLARLEKTPQRRLKGPKLFYKSLVSLSKNNLLLAKDQLYHLQNDCLGKKEGAFWLNQSFLAEALLDFERGDLESLYASIEKAKALNPAHPCLLFFEGLAFYTKGLYSETYRLWHAYSALTTDQNLLWLHQTIEKIYPSAKRKVHLAHCLLERGCLQDARSILEQLVHEWEDEPLHSYDLAHLFLGLSYLKEADLKPLQERESYYQLAYFYFTKSLPSQRDLAARALISMEIERHLHLLISQTLKLDTHPWFYLFIKLLKKWDEDDKINYLCRITCETLEKEQADIVQAFCLHLSQDQELDFFYAPLSEKLQERVFYALSEQDYSLFMHLYSSLHTLSVDMLPITLKLEKTLKNLIATCLYQDDSGLCQTQLLIRLFCLVQPRMEARQYFAFFLNVHAERLWNMSGCELQGKKLMHLALDLAPMKDPIQDKINAFLTQLYLKAEANNLLTRLSLVYDAFIEFAIPFNPSWFDEGKIANYMADAQYCFETKDFYAAKTYALWVLKTVPHHPQALALLGLCFFHLADYPSAIACLEKINNPDLFIQKALAFSLACDKQIEQEQITQIDPLKSFIEE